MMTIEELNTLISKWGGMHTDMRTRNGKLNKVWVDSLKSMRATLQENK